MNKASAEFVAEVRLNWYIHKSAIIPITITELGKNSKRFGILTNDNDEENEKEAEEIATRISDLMIECNTPDEYIGAFEREFLNPTFN